ncbi:glycosyltransferase family 2 protein [Hwangdonia lutea]|uniref:Glycosyltransferase family 2 protein n=1 Tax=Hwangdonia lutea TaxID=3075823 RepID=A0AA97EKZ9_9FLAO|nr:glycosyltransferase family 2 protein [Hwangdonia sp. SCSIO 19198]WOD43364.1 glycosyltransferase family 2 protein [Hwangdonia sp. SCSIO 19198]
MGITIGLPFYNAEDYLELSIKSVFAQTYTDWELILMDDGSTDKSLEIAKSINDPRVRVYSDGKNKKLAARLNDIVGLAKYEYLARMDADDLMSTTRLEKQYNLLKNNPGLDLISTGTVSIANDLTYLGSRGADVSNISFMDLLLKRSSPLHASILGRTAWFKRNAYNESLKIAQDYDLWLRSSKKNDFKLKIISDLLYYYREENNATPKKVLAAYKNERVMYKKYSGNAFYILWLKSKFKSIVVSVITFLNKEDILLKRRSHNNTNSTDKDNYLSEVELIKKTKLPTY